MENEERDTTCKCPIFLKFCMSIESSKCTKTVKYFDSMSAFARAMQGPRFEKTMFLIFKVA